MNHPRIITAVAAACVLAPAAFAETPLDSTARIYPEYKRINDVIKSVHVIGPDEAMKQQHRDSIESLVANFYYDQYRHFQDPQAPYFLFMSKDANLAMGVGGVIRMRGLYTWGNVIDSNGFVPYLIPMQQNPAQKRKLTATPAGVSVFMTILGRNTFAGRIKGFIQAGFSGYNNIDFKLKKAYVMVDDFTAGYTTSTFIDPAAQPSVIDGSGPNGLTDKTQVLVRYMHDFKEHWTVGGGVEIPSSTQLADDDVHTKAVSQYIPDVVAVGQYQWDSGLSHVRLSGLLHFSSYRNLVEGSNHTFAGYGAQLSAMVKVTPRATLYGQTVFGRGISSFLGDLSADRFELIADPNTPGRMVAPKEFSYTLGARCYILPQVYLDGGFAQVRFLPKVNPNDDTYKYGIYAFGNVFWDISPRFEIGAEYIYGRRKNFDGASAGCNRVNVMFQFNF